MKTELTTADKSLLAYVFSLADAHLKESISSCKQSNKNGELSKIIEDFGRTKENAEKLFYRLFNDKK